MSRWDGGGDAGKVYRVARGFDETWGRLRNSSRSIVPELSWGPVGQLGVRAPRCGKGRRTLSSFMNRFRSLSISSLSTARWWWASVCAPWQSGESYTDNWILERCFAAPVQELRTFFVAHHTALLDLQMSCWLDLVIVFRNGWVVK